MKIKIFNLIFLTIFIILKPMHQYSTTEEEIKKKSTSKAIQIIQSIALGGVTGTLSYFALKDNNYENNAQKLMSLLVGLTSSSLYGILILIEKLKLADEKKNNLESKKKALEEKYIEMEKQCNLLNNEKNSSDALNQENNQLKKELKELKESKEAIESLKEQKNELEKTTSSLEEENNPLKAQLNELKKELTHLSEKNKKINNKIERYQKESSLFTTNMETQKKIEYALLQKKKKCSIEKP